jgi:hypothetical protein
MAELTIGVVLDIIRTSGILVGIYYYITILKNQQQNRMKEMVFQRMQTQTPESIKDSFEVTPTLFGWDTVEEFHRKYNWKTTPDLVAKRNSIQNKLSSWGFLLREGLIDIDFVGRLFPPNYIMYWWEQNEPIYMDTRRISNNPEQFKDLELLYDAVKKRYPNITRNPLYYMEKSEVTETGN